MSEPRLENPKNRRLGYQDALDFLYGRIDYERATDRRNNHQFRLQRTQDLFERLGLADYLFHRGEPTVAGNRNPKVPLIHLAGTKGKGSTATMVSAILSAAGYRVGLYTSPHLTDLEERFRIDGVPCSQEALIELVEIIAPIVDQFDAVQHHTSFFELTTAMAILHFDRNDCDAIVLEVGLGGRLDSTNVCASTVAAITSIGLDHQRVLGDTIAEIAAEKAGIVKGAVPVVSGVTSPEAVQVIRAAAAKSGSPLLERGPAFAVSNFQHESIGSRFVFHAHAPELAVVTRPASGTTEGAAESHRSDSLEVYLPLGGEHQSHNAAVAISIVRLLAAPSRDQPLAISDEQIATGLANVECVGRMERFVLDEPPPQWDDGDTVFHPVQVILDTAHNPDSMAALCEFVGRGAAAKPSLAEETGGGSEIGFFHQPIVAVIGTSRDKDLSSMAAELAVVADEVICTRYTTNPRAVDESQLADTFANVPLQSRRPLVRHEADPRQALIEAIRVAATLPADSTSKAGGKTVEAAAGGTVVICGSFFLAGELRPALLEMPGIRRLADEAAGRAGSDANATLGKMAPLPGKFTGSRA